MNNYLKEVENRIHELEEAAIRAENRLKQSHDGILRINTVNNKIQYYHKANGERKNGKYLSVNDMELVRELAQKSYDETLLKAITAELKGLKHIINIKTRKPEEIFKSLSPQRQQLVVPEIITDEEYARKWLEQKYERRQFADGAPEFYTGKGDRVRSKSEIVIADMLDRLQYPYFYEMPLYLQDGVMLHPDFTTLNVRKRKVIYLEHLGMMDDEEYLINAFKRIAVYERNGIYLGDRLIVTYETSGQPLNTRAVEKKLRFYLD